MTKENFSSMNDDFSMSKPNWCDARFQKENATASSNTDMSLRNLDANLLRSDVGVLSSDDFLDSVDDLQVSLRSPPFISPPTQQHPAAQFSRRSSSSKSFDVACIVEDALELASTFGTNESKQKITIDLSMNDDAHGIDDDLSAAEFHPAANLSSINGTNNNIEVDMDDELSLAEFHPPSGEEQAQSPSANLFGHHNGYFDNYNSYSRPLSSNENWRSMTIMGDNVS
jgi:hypothetical protein